MKKKLAQHKSLILKICLFATGLSGIVAEFVLSTLASYLVGDSILQWSLIISFMLFAMGLGSLLTRFITDNLLDKFIATEYALSIFCSISAGLSYWLAAYVDQINLFIYGLAIIIGLLIGLEIPLVTRINEAYEELRINISTVMQYDYLGALIGGLFFSFFALPHLGLTYTPIVLGSINFLIALLLFWQFRELTRYKSLLTYLTFATTLFLVGLAIVIRPILLFTEQSQYRDKIIYQEQTPYQKLVITQWKHYYWLFINRNIQFSSYDEWHYHEPLVHPAMQVVTQPEKILILGGGDGMAVREILKYPGVQSVTLVDLDPAMTRLGQEFGAFVSLNQGALNDDKVRIINMDVYQFLKQDQTLYDVIIIDLPDPNNVELAKLYSRSFYQTARQHLSRYGAMVTQSTDVSDASKTFCCILKTIESAGFTALPYHNYVQTMGHWGWILGMNAGVIGVDELKQKISALTFDSVPTRFINQSGMISMMHFGKGYLEFRDDVAVNTELHPVVHQYYMKAYELRD